MNDPTAAYHGDNPESVAAWDSIADSAETLRRQVVDHIDSCGGHGATSDETEAALDLSHQTCSARFTEAKKYNQITPSGEKRMTRSGRWAAVYVTPRFHTGNIHRLPTRPASTGDQRSGSPHRTGDTGAGGAGRDAAKPLATAPATQTPSPPSPGLGEPQQPSTNKETTMSESFDLGGGAASFPFNNPGDKVTGKVLSMQEVQQTDIDTNEPAFWANGQPKMQFRVALATDLKDDPMDSGERAVYLNGSRKPESKSKLAAVLGAVRKATGGTNLAPGGTLTLQYDGDGARTSAGKNPPKQYSAHYVAPQAAGGDLAGNSRQAAPVGGEPPF